ncbi:MULTISPECIES: SDR family NAD(P)-dependent oxidoreductase [Sphingomonas]|uniref:Oxidoreductase n=1 Tax=Sphingomonas glacialis TaxID=658225 RepID=A0ABQ3LBD0_9SPHN|nr:MULTISPECIES: SDR family NAD(P)-dependent oxidoreductase [Sphingomonas]MDY7525242.1 SDR family NAD(P)-dependent oxidoreductase [Sphingomonas sp. 10B4]MEB0282067.1 SDR family NAD(P)-dependent oxidoreductase [Sphingomonas sp. 10B4]GHH10198.1 oxidoreductase [Sphingomonas glacialis]
MTDKPLANQVALVTGASRGIGAATALALGAAGAHVVITARTAAGLETVENAIFDAGGSATIAPLNLTETDSIARLGTAIGERWPALDILVLNAAMLGQLSAVPAIDAKEMAQVLTLNVSAQAALIAAFDPMLRKSAHGRVIGLTSSVGRKPRAYWGMYGASKAAFETLLSAYGDEMELISKVRTAIIDPGATRTAMRHKAYPGEDPKSVKDPSVVADRIVALLTEDFATGHFERVE